MYEAYLNKLTEEKLVKEKEIAKNLRVYGN